MALETLEVAHDLLQAAAQILQLRPVELALLVLSRDPAHQHTGQVEVAKQLCRRGHRRILLQLPLRLDEQPRLGEQALTQRGTAVTPRRVQLAHLTGRQCKRCDLPSETLAIVRLGARHRHQVLHRRMGADAAPTHLVLHRLGQLAHQGQPPRHPARAAVETLRQLLMAEPEARLQLGKQPALLKRRLALGRAQRPAQEQRLGLVHRPHRRPDRVLPEPPRRPDPLVAVNHHIASVRGARHHHDRRLLTVLRHRRQQPPLRVRTAYPKSLVSKLELVVLQIHPFLPGLELLPLEHRHQSGAGPISHCMGHPRSVPPPVLSSCISNCTESHRSHPGSPLVSVPSSRLSNCVERMSSRATAAIESLTCTPISSCIASHGIARSTPRTRIGDGRRGGFSPAGGGLLLASAAASALAARSRNHRARKYSGFRPRHFAWVRR